MSASAYKLFIWHKRKKRKAIMLRPSRRKKRSAIRTRRARNRRWHLKVPDLVVVYRGCFRWLPCCAVVISDYFGTNPPAVFSSPMLAKVDAVHLPQNLGLYAFVSSLLSSVVKERRWL
jgi:hypothetical protein